jgi:hypothetical protein
VLQRAGRRLVDCFFDRGDRDYAFPLLLLAARGFRRGVRNRKGFGLRFGELDCTAADVEGAAGVARYGGDFAGGELDGVGVDEMCGDVGEAGGYDGLELVVGVTGEGDTG